MAAVSFLDACPSAAVRSAGPYQVCRLGATDYLTANPPRTSTAPHGFSHT